MAKVIIPLAKGKAIKNLQLDEDLVKAKPLFEKWISDGWKVLRGRVVKKSASEKLLTELVGAEDPEETLKNMDEKFEASTKKPVEEVQKPTKKSTDYRSDKGAFNNIKKQIQGKSDEKANELILAFLEGEQRQNYIDKAKSLLNEIADVDEGEVTTDTSEEGGKPSIEG